MSACPLPPGWEARRDRTGRVYFVNHGNRETSWVDPRPLPDGWEQRVDQKTRRKYFANHLMKITQWHDPRPEPIIGVAVPSELQDDFKKMLIQRNKKFGHADRKWYKDVLKMALLNDVLTPDEDSLLAQVRHKLEITDDEHKQILASQGLTEADLKAKRKDQEGGKECVVCLDGPANHVLLDCMHICLCADCAKSLGSQPASKRCCPKCRKIFSRVHQVY